MKTLRHNFSVRWWLIFSILQVTFAAVGVQAYEAGLYWSKEKGDLFEYILYSVDFAPFITLAGSVFALGIIRHDSEMDRSIMFRTGNKNKYFRQKCLCSAAVVSLWVAAMMLIRTVTGVLTGYGADAQGGKADAIIVAEFMIFLSAYLVMVVWFREIVKDLLPNPILQNAILLLFSVTELAVCVSLHGKLLLFLPLGNVLMTDAAYNKNLWGRSVYWAFILYGLYYVKTEVSCKKEIGDM